MHPAISLGIDLGTSELKTVLMDGSGAVRGQASVRIDTSRPRPGWSEQSPQDWWAACVQALGQLRAAWPQDYAHVACIGLSGQMHGAVLLDSNDKVIRPAILWNDARADAEAAALARDYRAYADVTGSLPMAGLTAPKLLWLQKHEPAAFAAIACLLSPKDYLRLQLTGIKLTDMSDAAGTLWLDEAARAWFPPMVAACGLRLDQLPALAEGDAATGTVRAAVADQLGLPMDVVVAAGGGDNPVSAVGIGAVNGGDSFISLGTSAAIVSVTETPLGNPAGGVHSFCHALPGRWYAMGAILSGASCLRWATGVLGQPDEAALLALVENALPLDTVIAPSAPLFLPYLSGERTPHNDPQVRGAFLQLGHDSTPAQLGYAVLEGVAFALRDAMAAVTSTGALIPHCMLVGGGARSQYWAQLLANVLGREMRTLHNSELSASLGAAKLGFAAIGDASLLTQGLPINNVFQPDAAHGAALGIRYGRYRSLFPAVQALHQLSEKE
ncbi:xylulokinase [Janthinobacterium sp. BJB1]|nr:xylulokinase [Janthinobacterium sp. GW458P]MBE3024874.1 xylulokinase [Janthinobacterium sp. GW458P]PHV17832.1 xylulokinase [Janthinobacterium sp. BJB303]PJC99704.1 xylulokinase [Janthinobacterium sp. BJB1]